MPLFIYICVSLFAILTWADFALAATTVTNAVSPFLGVLATSKNGYILIHRNAKVERIDFDGRVIEKLSLPYGMLQDVKVSGERIALVRNADVVILNSSLDEIVKYPLKSEGSRLNTFSPDYRMAFLKGTKLEVLDLTAGTSKRIILDDAARLAAPVSMVLGEERLYILTMEVSSYFILPGQSPPPARLTLMVYRLDNGNMETAYDVSSSIPILMPHGKEGVSLLSGNDARRIDTLIVVDDRGITRNTLSHPIPLSEPIIKFRLGSMEQAGPWWSYSGTFQVRDSKLSGILYRLILPDASEIAVYQNDSELISQGSGIFADKMVVGAVAGGKRVDLHTDGSISVKINGKFKSIPAFSSIPLLVSSGEGKLTLAYSNGSSVNLDRDWNIEQHPSLRQGEESAPSTIFHSISPFSNDKQDCASLKGVEAAKCIFKQAGPAFDSMFKQWSDFSLDTDAGKLLDTWRNPFSVTMSESGFLLKSILGDINEGFHIGNRYFKTVISGNKQNVKIEDVPIALFNGWLNGRPSFLGDLAIDEKAAYVSGMLGSYRISVANQKPTNLSGNYHNVFALKGKVYGVSDKGRIVNITDGEVDVVGTVLSSVRESLNTKVVDGRCLLVAGGKAWSFNGERITNIADSDVLDFTLLNGDPVILTNDEITYQKHTIRLPGTLAVYSHNGAILAIMADGVVTILSESLKLLGHAYVFSDSALILTPEGYFSGSGKFENYLHYVIKAVTYPFDRFYDVFYRPDIVKAKLAGEDISSMITVTIDQAIKNPPPSAKLTTTPANTSNDTAKVCYEVNTAGGGIGEVRLFQNGKLIKSDGFYRENITRIQEAAPLKLASLNGRGLQNEMRRIAASSSGNTSFTQAKPKGDNFKECVNFETLPGENELAVYAFNGSNTVQSSPATATFTSNRQTAESHLYVLTVGIDEYRDSSATLRYAVKDSLDFQDVIKDKAGSIFDPKNIHVENLNNQAATKTGVQQAIQKIAVKVKPWDSFILFVASHGLLLENQYYVVTSGYNGTANSENLISSNEIVEISKNIRSLSQLFIFDTCHAGGVDTIVSGLYDARMSVLAKKMGLHIYASAGSVQSALDGFQGNGLFTHALLTSMKTGKNAAGNNGGTVSVVELGESAKKTTVDISSRIGHAQTPNIINFGRDYSLFKIR